MTTKLKFFRTNFFVLCIISFLTIQKCHLTDFYVRKKKNSNYGTGDGSSYFNAFNSLKAIDWTRIYPGDNVFICGLHLMNMTARSSVIGQGDVTPITSGNPYQGHVTIRGDCKYTDADTQAVVEEQGVVWGSYILLFEEWQDEGNNVWSHRLAGDGFYDWYFQDITHDNHIVLTRVETQIECENTPGSHFSDLNYGGSSGGRLFVHLADSGHPRGRVAANRYGYEFILDGTSYVTFYKLHLYTIGGYAKWESWKFHHITWEECIFKYHEHSFIRLYDGHHHIHVINCDMSQVANGIYTISGTNNAPSHYVFKGNKIYDVCLTYALRVGVNSLDCHGIGIQGGSYGVIEGNHITKCQSGVTMFSWGEQEQRFNVVKNNIVTDLHKLNGASKTRGIESSCSNENNEYRDGNVIEGNLVYSVDYGFVIQFDWTTLVTKNLAYNCSTGFKHERTSSQGEFGPQIQSRYNIVLDSRIEHVRFGSGGNNAHLDYNYNIYYPDGSDKFYLNNGNWMYFDDWKERWDVISNFGYVKEFVLDPNSQIIDLKVKIPQKHNEIFLLDNTCKFVKY